MKKKKICYVVTIPLTIRAFFIPQLKYLANNGFDVYVICSNDGSIEHELGDNVKYIPVDIPRGLSLAGSLRTIRKLKYIFKKEHFDLIQYSTPNAAFYASIAAKQAGCMIRNYHLMGFRFLGSHGIGETILKKLEKITCLNSTSIECVSMSNLEFGIKEGIFPKEKGSVIWNGSTGGVDLEKFNYKKRDKWRKEVRFKLGYSPTDFVFGFVGRITKDKGINEILEAYKKLNDNTKLLLVGPMEGLKSLDQQLLLWAKGNRNIIFHSAVENIESYYAAIDVLLLPSYREGFGNVIIEAGAVGTPAIVSRIPGPIDTICEGKTALTIRVKDVDDLLNKMHLIQDMDYIAMGKKAALFAQEMFDSNVLCEKIFERKQVLLDSHFI